MTPRTQCRPSAARASTSPCATPWWQPTTSVRVLSAGGNPAAIDATTRRVQGERWPEVVTVQELQENQGSVFFNDHWGVRLMFRLLPWLMRAGILQWLQRKEKRLMADGVVPVRLVV